MKKNIQTLLTVVKYPLLMTVSASMLWGGVKTHKPFYITPLQTNSHQFDTVDLVSGAVKENIIDFAKGSKLPFVRTYTSNNKRNGQPLGNFTHSFDKKLNAKIPYKKEVIGSKRKQTPKLACEMGWKDISPTVYLGKLEDLSAVYDDKTGLCQVYDAYDNLKTTLIIKNKATRTIANSEKMKLLTRPDGTEVLFYKNEDGTWSNTSNEAIKFTQTRDGYELLLESANIESYSEDGRLQEIKSDAKVYTLAYDIDGKLASIDDNFEHTITFEYTKNGKRLKKVTNFDGTSVKYRYKGKKLSKVIYPDGRVEAYKYEKKKLVKVIKDNVLQRAYRYDSQGRVERVSGINDNNPKTFTYDKDGIEVEENGLTTAYTFIVSNSQAKLDTVEDDEGILSYTYDDNGHQLSMTDKIGLTRVTTYSKDGLLVEDKDAVGTEVETTTKTQYDSTSQKPTVIQSDKVTEYRIYDDEKKLTYKVNTLVDLNGAVLQYKLEHLTYDDRDLVAKVETDAVKQTVNYDTKANVIATKNHLGLEEKITEYNQADLPLTSVDSDGVVTQNTYDATGKKLSTTEDGKTTKMKYDKKGRLTERASTEGIVSYFKYDDEGNIIESGESTGEKNIYTYDEQTNLIKTQRYEHNTLVYSEEKTYDAKRRLISQTDAYGNTTKYTYNQVGQKAEQINADGSVVRYEYNEVGKLSKEVDPLGGETHYSYDAQGHTTKIVTPNGATFSYAYDGFGRLISETNPDKGSSTYTYDAADKLLTTTDANGQVTTNEYDTLGRLVAMHYEDASLDVSYTYNAKSEIVKITDASGSTATDYDKENLLSKTQVIATQTFITHNTYTEADKLATRTYPSGMKLSYTYNSDSEIQSLYVNDSLLIDNISLKNGQLQNYSYADGSKHKRTYDLAGRITELNYPSYHENIAYNDVSAMIGVRTTAQDKHYNYDFAGRLIAYDNNQSQSQNFSYDANGNRLSLVDATSGLSHYTYMDSTNILNQFTRTLNGVLAQQVDYVYDEAGNILDDGKHTYSYDARNRLVSINNTVTYAYNAANYRVSKTVEGIKTYFIYDGHTLLGEYDADGKVLREYIYLDDTPIAMLSEGKTYYIYADYLNTPRRVADENHAILWSWESSPYGESKPTGSLVFNLRFPGQYYDAETGHHYNINRDYNPVTGRYTQSDPVGFKGGVNTYAYAEGNPVMKKDEMGLWASGKYESKKVHQRANTIVFGYGWIKSILDTATVNIDKSRFQQGHYSYLHAMKGYPSRGATRIDSYISARVRSENFVINGMWMARTYLNRGDVRRAWANFGWVLHTMQDSTSPVHTYFKKWTGNESLAMAIKHGSKENYTPNNMNHRLYRASRWIHHMFHYRLIPRHGAIFNFFH